MRWSTTLITSRFDDVAQPRKVHHIAGAGIDRAFDRNVEGVVVPVPVRIVALPEGRFVLRVGEYGIEHAMSGVETAGGVVTVTLGIDYLG